MPSKINRITVKQSEFDCDKLTYGKIDVNKQYNFTKIYLNYDSSAFVVESEDCEIVFCKKQVSDEGRVSYNIGLTNTNLESLIDTKINEKVITDGATFSEKWFGEEKDEEVCRDIYRNPYIPPNDKYKPCVVFTIKEYSLPELFSNMKDVTEVESVLSRGTIVKLAFTFPCLTIKGNSLRLNGEVFLVKVVKTAENAGPKSINLSDYSESNLKLGDLIKTDRGGKKTIALYDGGPLTLKLDDVKLVYTKDGILAKKFNEDDADRYCLNLSLAGDLQEFYQNLDTRFKKLLFENHMEYYGKKKSLKLIDSGYRSQCYYSKAVLDKIKKGETPEYPPTLTADLPYWDGTARYKVFKLVKDSDGNVVMETDSDGNETPKTEPFTDDFDEFIKNNDKPVSLVLKCRHIWFGSKTTVKWDVLSVVIDGDVSSSSFKFSDDFDEPTADDVPTDDEPDEDEDEDETEDEDED